MVVNKYAYMAGFVTCLAFFNACGDDVTNVYENSGPERVDKFKDLPKCDSKEEGALVYVKDSAKVFVCDDEGWSLLNGVDGKDGKDGDNGKDGIDGKDGKDGDNGKDGKDGVNGKDGLDGKDGKDGVNGKDGIDGKDGKDGTNGKDGTSCSVAALDDASGFKVLCGKDSVGVVKNGKNGVGCTLDDDGSGSVKVTCGEGENATEATLYKALCGKTPYDPQKRFCANAELYEFCNGKVYDPSTEICSSRNSTYQLYKYVNINGKIWMSENLNYKTEGSYCYDDKEANCNKYGRLYTWTAAVGKSEDECGYGHSCSLRVPVKGVCPDGWHIPSEVELAYLVTAWNRNQDMTGKKLKSDYGWADNGQGDDYFGFAALPAGLRNNAGDYLNMGDETYFWSTVEFDDSNVNVAYLTKDADIGYLTTYAKVYALSVRCVKDDKWLPL